MQPSKINAGQPVRTIIDKEIIKGKSINVSHKFYAINSADQILHTRMMVAEIQELYIKAGISQPFLKEMVDLILNKAMSAQDFNNFKLDIINIAQHLKQRIGFIAQKSMYEELACVYFMLEDEPAEYLPEWQEKKKALWRKHPEERDFFTTEAFRLTSASQNISMGDILSVWEALEERLGMLPKLSN
jgi:hypothetical protein